MKQVDLIDCYVQERRQQRVRVKKGFVKHFMGYFQLHFPGDRTPDKTILMTTRVEIINADKFVFMDRKRGKKYPIGLILASFEGVQPWPLGACGAASFSYLRVV